MTEPLRVALVGDPNDERFRWFSEFLADDYAIVAARAKTVDEVKKFADDTSGRMKACVIFLTDDLPLSDEPSVGVQPPYINFLRLEWVAQFFDADFVCIVTKVEEPDNLDKLRRRPLLVDLRTRTFPPHEEERVRIRLQLRSLGRRLPPAIELSSIAGITEWDRGSRTLRRQIRSLSERHDLADGLKHLLRLIRNCLDCRLAEKIEIKQLGRGKSGASVLRLILTREGRPSEYVLKLSDALWKLESEVRGHLASQEVSQTDYERHVAILRQPVFPFKPAQREGGYIANSGQWYGIHYDFLGGPTFGKFVDLETALTAAPAVLADRTAGTPFAPASDAPEEVLALRLKVFEATLDGLCDIWYGNAAFGARRVKTAWKIEDAPDREFIPLPPYQLTRRVKGWVQDFLDSREALIGARLLFPDWDAHQERVLKLVSDDSAPAALGRLGVPRPFTLSPVHGDLNANNVLLWLRHHRYPFVIDLPFYQKDGHALQDFARLEVEIKYALLDRQEESPKEGLAAYDYSGTQVPLWIEMENRLLEEQALSASGLSGSAPDGRVWGAPGLKENVTLCYKIIMLARAKACQAQQKPLPGGPDPGPFAEEYLPALLYHSVRAIGYPSLSVFKRLLALYSSGSILKSLE